MSKVSKIHCTDFNALNAMYVSKVSKILYRFQCIKCYVCVEGVEDTLYRFQCIKCYVCRRRRRWCLRLFTQHCMQSTDIMSEMSKILCIQWPLAPPGGKAHCCRTVCPVGLAVHHHAVRGGSFVFKCSGTCQTTRVIAGKTHSQSPILKCYGGCSATQ